MWFSLGSNVAVQVTRCARAMLQARGRPHRLVCCNLAMDLWGT
jgi:hypothetical protein